MRTILLVEDDTSLGETLSIRLSKDYQVSWAQSCREARKLMQETRFDLAIFDVGLPDGEGFDLAKDLRLSSKAPFIFLTAQSDADSRLRGYDMGAQEYIPKPFLLRELLLRIEHVFETSKALASYSFKNLEIRLAELRVVREGTDHALTSSESKLLEILLDRSPKLVSRDDLINFIWGADSEVSPRTLDNMITKVRQILGPHGDNIKTIRGAGYQWIESDSGEKK